MKPLLSTLFLIISLSAFSQKNIDTILNTYATRYAQERLHLHFDKPTYSAGETIWFKAYMMEGILPAEGSKTLYTDWTDEKGNVLHRSVSPMVDGTTAAQFEIPASYTGKFIHLRSYTKWMLNFDSSFFFNKDIRILSANPTVNSGLLKNTQPPTIKFFPEGGDALAGVGNKIAFKATDQWGRPVKVRGVVKDAKGKVADSLRTQHDGMGFVFLNPSAGDSYSAVWEVEIGKSFTTALPSIKNTGAVLQVTLNNGKRFFNVAIPAGEQLGKLHVIGTMNQFPVFHIAKDANTQEIKGAIPTEQLPSGVLTITVLNDAYQPLSERVLFINNEEYLFTAEMNVAHWGLNKRAKNEIEIMVPDSIGASLSVSVTDADIDTDSTSIISQLLLSSELRGEIYKPAYYFQNKSDSIAKKLDLVMLTNGWRRYNWNMVAKGEFPQIKYRRDTAYMHLSGRIYGATPAELKEAGSIFLIVKQLKAEGGNILPVPVDASGYFEDKSIILLDSTSIYHQMQDPKKLKNVTVKYFENKLLPFPVNPAALGRNFNPSADTSGIGRNAFLAKFRLDAIKAAEGKMLEGVVVKSKMKTPVQELDERYASGMFTGSDAYQFDLLNDPFAQSSMNIFQYLQGKVAGLQIENAMSPDGGRLSWRGGTPQMFLNEVPTDNSMIATIVPSEVAYIKVFRPPFMGSARGSGGAIAIYTRRGGDARSSASGGGLRSNVVAAYSQIKEFSSPNYASFKPEYEQSDSRTTLFWEPNVITGPGQRKVKLTFYNNDVSRAFRVIIEGMTRDGRLTRVEQMME